MLYLDAESEQVRSDRSDLLREIQERGLLFPVTVVDGIPVYDGAVSYPAIMRVVNNKLLEQEPATNS